MGVDLNVFLIDPNKAVYYPLIHHYFLMSYGCEYWDVERLRYFKIVDS